MTNVRGLALGILLRVEGGAHAAPILDARGRDLSPRDRGLLRSLVKMVLRQQLRLDHVVARSVDRPLAALDLPVRVALRLGAAQLLLMDRIPGHAAVGETVEALKVIAPRAASLVNAVLRRIAAQEARGAKIRLPEGASRVESLALESSHPEWLVARWLATFGEEQAGAALAAGNEDAPMDLLLDPRIGSAETTLERFSRDGVVLRRSPWAPLAYTVVSGDAARHPLVTSGAVAVVDAAAQAMAELVPVADLVVDLTAAPGGKTRALLASGRAKRVVALERNGGRVVRLAKSLAAAGRRAEVLVVRADVACAPLPKGRFRSILLDAPCSGTGTLRKNPEIRWRLRPEELPALAAIQRALLLAALDLLAPGGRVIYVTCSLEPEENEQVVADVLAARPGARSASFSLEQGSPLSRSVVAPGFLRVLPGQENDGFSAAALTIIEKEG